MQPVWFETALVERLSDGTVLIVLFNGSVQDGAAPERLFKCQAEAAVALWNALGSALKA